MTKEQRANHDTTTSVHDTTTSVHDTTTSVHDTTTSVHDTTTSVHDTTTSVHDTTTSVHDTHDWGRGLRFCRACKLGHLAAERVECPGPPETRHDASAARPSPDLRVVAGLVLCAALAQAGVL